MSELSLTEVFDSRLSQLEWQTDEEIARKTRLTQLFTELSVELSLKRKQAASIANQKSDADKAIITSSSAQVESTSKSTLSEEESTEAEKDSAIAEQDSVTPESLEQPNS